MARQVPLSQRSGDHRGLQRIFEAIKDLAKARARRHVLPIRFALSSRPPPNSESSDRTLTSDFQEFEVSGEWKSGSLRLNIPIFCAGARIRSMLGDGES